ncbi:hypothetical protein QTO34_009411 [Cnephaeus nilssonii]|uniref:Uncharacterized protein n=1 Tax=Cnephaeus nilssonii TaxID=3371016 RepID=A0AA40LG62_CNENI|nr:hypothetical protein QTO34_009411 [Eptesicus nilssonii]
MLKRRLALSCCRYRVSRVIVTEQMSGLLLRVPWNINTWCGAGGSHRCDSPRWLGAPSMADTIFGSGSHQWVCPNDRQLALRAK